MVGNVWTVRACGQAAAKDTTQAPIPKSGCLFAAPERSSKEAEGKAAQGMTSDVGPKKKGRRRVKAHLVEATPPAGGWGHWLLSAPAICFLGWLWLDLFGVLSPIQSRPLDLLLGALAYVFLVLLPFGYGAHRLVTSFPGLFQQAGWTVQPLEPLKPQDQYTVKYLCLTKERAVTDGKRVLLRVAQGWVYLEIGAILVSAVAMVPLFFSAVEFGFGR